MSEETPDRTLAALGGHATASDDALLNAIEHRSNIVLIITLAARLEDWLQAALESKMRPISKTLKERLFRGYGPMSSFSAKIDIGYALKLYDDDIFGDLKAIKDIRNGFAHAKNELTYDSPEISPHFPNLTGWTKHANPHMLLLDRMIACVKVFKGHLEAAILVKALEAYKAQPAPSPGKSA